MFCPYLPGWYAYSRGSFPRNELAAMDWVRRTVNEWNSLCGAVSETSVGSWLGDEMRLRSG